jgi:hypothetical protein
MAAFMVRAFEFVTFQNLTATGDAFDDDNGSELEDDINAGFEAGLFQGRAPRVFDPTSTVHRDQMASFLLNLVDALTSAGFPPTS